jgi:hypothetical protein
MALMESITMTHRTEQIAGAVAMCAQANVPVLAGTRGWAQGTTVPSAGLHAARLMDRTDYGYAVATVPFPGDVYPLRGVPPV